MTNLEKIILNIVENKTPCVFVSPHLDDAIFSAGGLILELAGKTDVAIVTLLTKAGLPPYTLSAKAHLKHSGYGAASAEDLASIRKQEDIRACKMAGANFKHLEFTDALWRRKEKIGFLGNLLKNIFPEMNHLYPFYGFNVISRKVVKGDSATVSGIKNKLISMVREMGNAVIFCPIGAGNHVDHIIARDICAEIFPRAIFWMDFPYSLNFKPDKDFISKISLSPCVWNKNLQRKKDLILEYKTQIKDIAPMISGDSAVLQEIFYTASHINL
jgi:LmbE family N-acetylglucosaminyl deacetylase